MTVEEKLEVCPITVFKTGDPKPRCLLKNYDLCYCKNYGKCETYLNKESTIE